LLEPGRGFIIQLMKWRRLVIGLFAACFLFTCERKPKSSVILIVLDTVRQDHLSLYGYPRKTTPFLDKLAEECVVFNQARSPIPHTVPAHASLFSSSYPAEHRLLFNGWRLEEWPKPLLAEVLKAQGYETGAVIGSAVLTRWHGLDRGFDWYQDQNFERSVRVGQETGETRERLQRRAGEVVAWAEKWLEQRNQRKPFFLFLHFWDAHYPYDLPEEFVAPFTNDASFQTYLSQNSYLQKQRFADVNTYDNSLAYLDHELEGFFSYLEREGLLEHTLIIITSDHGEGLGRHNWYKHSINLYEEQILIPLLFRFPDRRGAGQRIEAAVNLIDLAPTVLDFLGFKDLMNCRGTSLLPLISGEKFSLRDCDFFERRWYPENNPGNDPNWSPGQKTAVVCGNWKYVSSSAEKHELFNLGRDRLELNNLLELEPGKAQELAAKLSQFRKSFPSLPGNGQAVPETLRKKLKSLGYAQ